MTSNCIPSNRTVTFKDFKVFTKLHQVSMKKNFIR